MKLRKREILVAIRRLVFLLLLAEQAENGSMRG